ncbi:MAG: tetratricopeptide repeat protein [Deltaproteobacteria bacterium]|nr:tetratricopeptide repeat protein [Deltaproteobacteria bacterium]
MKSGRWLILILLVFLVSCLPPKRAKRRPTPSLPPQVVTVPEAPPPVAEPTRPERNASNTLIVRGKNKLEVGETVAAAELFHEAINLDPTNGPAYYYLAYAKYRTGELSEVMDLLDRGENLLSGKKDWLEVIGQLRSEVQAASPAPVQ